MDKLQVEELEPRQLLSGTSFSPRPPSSQPSAAGALTAPAAERSPFIDYGGGHAGPAGVMIIAVLAAGCGSRPASIASDRSSPSAAKRLSAHASAAWLAGNGIGPSRFGQPERHVLAELDAILGPPTRPYRASALGCGVDHAITWQGLEAYFGSGRFAGYSYQGTHLQITARLRVGDSVRQARQLYGNALRLIFEQRHRVDPVLEGLLPFAALRI